MAGIFQYVEVEVVLRRRGHVVARKGPYEHPFSEALRRTPFRPGENAPDLYTLFSRPGFRKVLRRLSSSPGQPVPLGQLVEIAGPVAHRYVAVLTDREVAEVWPAGVVLKSGLGDLGRVWEWYVAQLCRRELWGSADWSVSLRDLRAGGDFDVVAWLDPTLVYIELKSARPTTVPNNQLRHFLQRTVELAPDLAILLIDTEDSLTDFLARLTRVMLPVVRAGSGIRQPDWQPERPFVRPQAGYPGVSYGYRRIYVTNSQPSILKQLRLCLRH
jgi:hypothetical protein